MNEFNVLPANPVDEEAEKYNKRIKKRKFNEDMTLNETLMALSVDELKDLCKEYAIKGYSKLKKGELANLVEKTILDELNDIVFGFNMGHFQYISGQSQEMMDQIHPEILATFEELGLQYRYMEGDEDKFFMPADVINHMLNLYNDDEVKELVTLNTLFIDFMDMFLQYYGVISYEKVVPIFNTFLELDINRAQFDMLLDMNNPFFETTKFDEEYLYYFRCEDYKTLNSFIGEVTDKDHKIIQPAEFEKFLERRMVWTESHARLVDFFQVEYDMDILNALLELDNVFLMMNYNYTPDKVLDDLKERLGTLDVMKTKELTDHLMAFSYEMPHWVLKGWSPKELREKKPEPVRKDKKIGRNEPCPCGSGKKYKKCCLNKQ